LYEQNESSHIQNDRCWHIYIYTRFSTSVYLYILNPTILTSVIKRKNLSLMRVLFWIIATYNRHPFSNLSRFKIEARWVIIGKIGSWKRAVEKMTFFTFTITERMNIRGGDTFWQDDWFYACKRKNKWSSLNLPCKFGFHFWTTRIFLPEHFQWRDLFQLATTFLRIFT